MAQEYIHTIKKISHARVTLRDNDVSVFVNTALQRRFHVIDIISSLIFLLGEVWCFAFGQIIAENGIGSEGCRALCEMIKNNPSLLTVDMSGKIMSMG